MIHLQVHGNDYPYIVLKFIFKHRYLDLDFDEMEDPTLRATIFCSGRDRTYLRDIFVRSEIEMVSINRGYY
jgi:hypothetical protein